MVKLRNVINTRITKNCDKSSQKLLGDSIGLSNGVINAKGFLKGEFYCFFCFYKTHEGQI